MSEIVPDTGRLDGNNVLKAPAISEPRTPARITVVENIYYHVRGESPMLVNSRYVRTMQTTEQAYGPRRVQVGEEWTRLDLGWVKRCGMLHLENVEGRSFAVIPTPSQLQDLMMNGLVEIACSEDTPTTPHFYLPPRESMRVVPISATAMWARCRKGTVRLLLTAIPG